LFVYGLLADSQGIKPYHSWGRHYLLAFDAFYDKEGNKILMNTGLYVPNEYMMDVVSKYPGMLGRVS
jgi:hypothetical protein